MTKKVKAVSKIFIQGSIEAVWREITKTDEPQQCFFNNWMHTNRLEPGGQIRMQSLDRKYTGVVGEILEFDPPRRFAHTFRFTQYDDPPCKVIYELEEVEGGVEFTLTADDIPAATKTEKQMGQGVGMITKTLKDMVEKGRPALATRMLFVLFKLMTPFTPKQCLSENWPLEVAS